MVAFALATIMTVTSGLPIFSLLHATRGRPEPCHAARKLWLDLAKNPSCVEHLFAVDEDDEVVLRATENFHRTIVEKPNGSGKAFNAAAAASTGHVMILMADDVVPPRHWDELILARMGEKLHQPLVLAVWDGARPDALIVWPICTREYYKLHPEFLGPYHGIGGDIEFSWRAFQSGCVLEAREILFFHDHPFTTGKALDSVYSQQNHPIQFSRALALFFKRNPEALIVESQGTLWLCYQARSGEYMAIFPMLREVVMRVRSQVPTVPYISGQFLEELGRRMTLIAQPEIDALLAPEVKEQVMRSIVLHWGAKLEELQKGIKTV